MPTVTTPYTGFTSSDKPASVTTTYPDAVPTKAPGVNQPAVTPTTQTTVLNSNPAKAETAKMETTMKTAQQSLAEFQAKKNISTIDKKTGADGTSELFMSDGSRVKTDANGNVMPTKSVDEQMLDIPSDGYKWAYNSSGEKTPIPLTDTATRYGLMDNNPTVAPTKPVLEETSLSSGTRIVKYNDGTYSKFGVDGKYLGNATQNDFKTGKDFRDVNDKLSQAINGNYPLKPNQIAQIDAIKAQYANLIKQQETANANLTGGTTVAQNMYGIGNTTMAMGQIKGTVDSGIEKVVEIQSKMNSDVAKMTLAFESDNLDDLKMAYTSFAANSKALQDNIDKTHDDVAQIAAADKNQRAQANLAIDNDIRQLMGYARGVATPEQLQRAETALQNHDMVEAMNALGDSTRERSPAGKEYDDYVVNATKVGLAPVGWQEYQTLDANRKAKVAAAGSVKMGGENGYTKDQYKIVTGINNVIMGSPVYKTVQSATAFVDGVKASLAEGTGLGDIAAINQFQKVIDEGAVTRDQDVKLVTGAQTVMDRLSVWKERNLNTGEVMTPELRAQMNSVMESLLKVKVNRLLKSPEIASQLKIAERSGLTAEDTVISDIGNIQVSLGDEIIKESVNKADALDTWLAKDPVKNVPSLNKIKAQFPGKSPEWIHDKLKELKYISFNQVGGDTNLASKPKKSLGRYALEALGAGTAEASMVPSSVYIAERPAPTPKNGVIAGYDITRYATDPKHEEKIAGIIKNVPAVATSSSLDSYIKQRAPQSPVTGDMVKKAADKYKVSPQMIIAIIQNDSSFGTKGKGARTKNPGNYGNDDTGALMHFKTWDEGVMAVAKWLDKNRA